MSSKKSASKQKKPLFVKPLKKSAVEKSSAPAYGDAARPAKGVKTPSLLRGMKDILPKEGDTWLRCFDTAANIARAYEFGYIETPVVEEASLFIRSIGRGTDVVDKEMYVFEDRDGSRVALRPEGTASVARAYITHGMHSIPQPVKAWYWGPMFRHDRPQAGRYREFHQFSCETLGERSPVVDAELIVVAYNYLRDLGIQTGVRVNSIGTPEERERYVVELSGYLRSKRSYLPEEIRARMHRNTLRVLDSKLPEMQTILEEAPQIIDWLGDESKKYFMGVLEYLDELDIPYALTPTLVRGLDYYTDTVFELFEENGEEGSQSALGGGGRYDLLVEQLGGRPTPAAGFSIGIERVLTALRKAGNGEEAENAPRKPGTIYFAQLGDAARKRSLKLVEQLRRGGIFVHHTLGKSSLKTQLETANKMGVSHTVILGQKEVQDGTIIVRDMDSGIQEIIDQKKLKLRLEKILSMAGGAGAAQAKISG